MGMVLIDSLDIGEALNVWLERGGLQVFEVPPTPKEPFFNEWADQDGRDYDEQAPHVYEAQIFEVPFIIHANGISEYREAKRQFMELINFNGEFDLQILDWGEAFRLRYKGVVSWGLLNKSLENTMYARFILRLECNHGAPLYEFKYLADNQGRYIVINDGQKILVKTSLQPI